MRSTPSASGGASPAARPASAGSSAGATLSSVSIALDQFVARLARALEPLLGGGARLARPAHRFERGAGGAVGVGERRLGGGARVGGAFARRLRRVEFAHQLPALLQEDGRRLGERRQLRLGGGAPLADVGDMRVRLGAALGPRPPLVGDRAPPRFARLRFAREILRRRLRLGEFGPLLRGERARALERQRQFVARREIGERGFVLRLALGRLAPLRSRRAPALRRAPTGATASGRAGVRSRRACRAPRRGRPAPRARFGARRSRRSAASRNAAWALPASARASAAAWRAASASRDRSPSRFFSASRCAAGVGASAVETKPSQRHRSPSSDTSRCPAFSKAVARRAPSARATTPICASRRRSAGGASTRPASGSTPCGSSRIALAFAQRPMRRRGGIDRGLQIVAERGAERRLVAARDVDRVDRRPPLAARRRADQLGQRVDFRVDALGGALGLGERPARARFRFARLAHAPPRRRAPGLPRRRAPRPSVSTASASARSAVFVAGGGLQLRRARARSSRIRSRTARAGASLRRGRRRARCGAR